MDIQQVVSELQSTGALNKAAGDAGISSDHAQNVVQAMLEHAQGGAGATELITSVAAKCGLQPDQIQALLPHVMPLLQRHAEGAAEGDQGMLGGLIASARGLLGGFGKPH
jgi:hypothetical protein